MPSQLALPHLLTPYVVSPPQSTLTLVSSILGATGNWLVLRFLYAALGNSPASNPGYGGPEAETRKTRRVVLVSFLRGWEFWRSEAKRLGLDLARLTEKRQFAFVDGLSELFSAPSTSSQPAPTPQHYPGTGIAPRTTLPIRSQPAPARSRQPVPASTGSDGASPRAVRQSDPIKRLHFAGSGLAALDTIEKEITMVINELKASGPEEDEDDSEILLVIDQPDFLLAATGLRKGIGATEMGEWIMGLQQAASATIATISADSPLIHNASTFVHQATTPLETEHAAFAVGMAHRASMIMQLRNLETGAARDVSGVLRVSKGGAWGQRESASGTESWEEKEVLYFVQRDGGANVFGRGE
ncbi:hypothetical protein BJX68DRAFT_81434 [Aspergillus pseudodeflectus]|uniref:Elongator complex protein 6 n=1 Tax=Aspergillus pseudodeflectus TaxID=176178 RepID=A0ABR4L6U6_9EURO